MKKEYWFILITYTLMQLSSFLGVPLVAFIAFRLGYRYEEVKAISASIWLIFSFTIALILVLFFLRKEQNNPVRTKQAASPSISLLWAIAGIFMSLFAQSIAASIENMLGVEMGSKNTQAILQLIKAVPLLILVSSIIGPILEEIVFRKIIFGSLYKRMNFFLSSLISSVIFALAHFEVEHVLLYSAMGFTFAFLYIKTNRIIVPIFAHVAMNTLVVVIQLNQEHLMKWLQQFEKVNHFIGGF
ncbi:type II CAAX endopeptidase family protein [Bacillus sp. 03113]|uniref:type II CAAX endopeptidase family protein n=1 Tax=Bacillus sp. 03113 TaxID=2578211 RepID=UPI0011411A90|nr:type II CAAX endopeptidase family protein [Bacillus sp. 03113]